MKNPNQKETLDRSLFFFQFGLTILGLSAASLLGSDLRRPFEGGGSRPNVLFIMTDQQRYDSLGCNGNSDAVTPNIDNLAREGVRFDSAYASQPVCSPTRSSIQTGLYPHKTEVWDNNITLTDHSTSFPKLLHEAGYTTGYIGKWHLGPNPDPFKRPSNGRQVDPPPEYFDVWKGYDSGVSYWIDQPQNKWTVPRNHETAIPDFGEDGSAVYRIDQETDEAIAFMQAYRDRPFCLFLSFTPPHTPWTAPLENCRRFENKVIYPTYYAMVNRIDENVGRLMDVLDGLGILEDTLIVYTSDHGHEFTYRWNHQSKRNCYDTASKIPLIFHWKGELPGGERSHLVSHVDLAPTLLEMCGLAIPEGIHGESLQSLLYSPEASWRDSVYIQNHPFKRNGEHAEDGSWAAMAERCIVTNEWKLIINSIRPPELYSRIDDPEEKNNRWDDPGLLQVKKTLYKRMEAWAWEIGDGLALSNTLLYRLSP